ncbi:MAG: hypothetical protein R2733_01505 [Acidimicrobiales bacterium]
MADHRLLPPARRSPLDLAVELGPLLESQSETHDRTGRLSDAALGALVDANLFGVLVPETLGGFEASPTEALDTFAEVSRADGAAGWVLTTCSFANALAGAFLSDDAVDEIFGPRMPIIAGGGAPRGRATPVDGGLRLAGHWGYGSGIHHATHLHNGGFIIDEQGTVRDDLGHHIFVAPIEAATLDDEWDVIGLRGSGSVDYTIDGAFIPTGYEHPIRNPTIQRGGSLYQVGMFGLVCIAHTGFFIGIGRRILDELAAIAVTAADRPGTPLGGDAFLERYGQGEALYRAARALVFERWREVEGELERSPDRPIGPRQLSSLQLAMYHMAWASTEVAEMAYKSGGGIALRDGPLQRAFRDCMAGRQHAQVSNAVVSACGRSLLSTFTTGTKQGEAS